MNSWVSTKVYENILRDCHSLGLGNTQKQRKISFQDQAPLLEQNTEQDRTQKTKQKDPDKSVGRQHWGQFSDYKVIFFTEKEEEEEEEKKRALEP